MQSINYDTAIASSRPGAIGANDLTAFTPNYGPDGEYLYDGAFYGGRGTDQYSGYQGDIGNFADAGAQYTDNTALQACFNVTSQGQQASGAIQNEVNAGEVQLAAAQTIQELDAANSAGKLVANNEGGNVAQGMADLAGRGVVISAIGATIAFGAQAVLEVGGVAEALGLASANPASGGTALTKALASIVTSSATMLSSQYTFGTLNADEATAVNAVDRTIVGLGNSLANALNYAPIGGFNPLV